MRLRTKCMTMRTEWASESPRFWRGTVIAGSEGCTPLPSLWLCQSPSDFTVKIKINVLSPKHRPLIATWNCWELALLTIREMCWFEIFKLALICGEILTFKNAVPKIVQQRRTCGILQGSVFGLLLFIAFYIRFEVAGM